MSTWTRLDAWHERNEILTEERQTGYILNIEINTANIQNAFVSTWTTVFSDWTPGISRLRARPRTDKRKVNSASAERDLTRSKALVLTLLTREIHPCGLV